PPDDSELEEDDEESRNAIKISIRALRLMRDGWTICFKSCFKSWEFNAIKSKFIVCFYCQSEIQKGLWIVQGKVPSKDGKLSKACNICIPCWNFEFFNIKQHLCD